MITYKDIQKNKEINAMIEQGNQVLKTLGCLLYTSPSPRDYAASRMPSSA